MPTQTSWYWCHKCQGLFFFGSGLLGRCPAGATHTFEGSANYALQNDSGGAGQHGWRFCWRCHGLFFGNSAQGRCSAGGRHDGSRSGDYSLVTDGVGQGSWRWCQNCQGLFFAGGSLGRCPAGWTHTTEGSDEYRLPFAPSGPPAASVVRETARDFSKHGTWFRDGSQRYVLFRGVNFGARAKLPPYVPVYPIDAHNPQSMRAFDIDRYRAEIAARRAEFDLLGTIGCNVVRLLLMWKALEPVPNPNLESLLPEGEEYLRVVTEVIEEFHARGILVLIDFHQDIAHEIYGGCGFPDWALAIDEAHPRPAPSDLRDASWGLHQYDTPLTRNHPLVRHTLRSFWRNQLRNSEAGLDRFPVQSHFVKTIGQTARFFRKLYRGQGHAAILGYELFNEPHPVGIDKADFEMHVLPNFYAGAIAEIRRFDDRAFVFIEPRVDWTTYSADGPEYQFLSFTLTPETRLDVSALPADRTVFAFHHYDPWTLANAHLPAPLPDDMENKQRQWPDVYRRMTAAGTSRGLIPFLTEFGADNSWQFDTNLRPGLYGHRQARAYIDLQYQQIEANLLNATYWNFDLCNTSYGKDNWNLEDFSLLGPGRTPRHLDLVARPYPMRSSARPSSLRFDAEHKHCMIVLDGPVVSAPTLIYVPRGTHYPTGFAVRCTGGGLSWQSAKQLLQWQPNPALPRNVLTISPNPAPLPLAPPADLASLLAGSTPTYYP